MESLKADEPEVELLEQVRLDLGEIEDRWVTNDFAKDQLKHMHDTYKADILALQEKCQRRKENLRQGKLRREKLTKDYNNLRKQMDRFQNKTVIEYNPETSRAAF